MARTPGSDHHVAAATPPRTSATTTTNSHRTIGAGRRRRFARAARPRSSAPGTPATRRRRERSAGRQATAHCRRPCQGTNRHRRNERRLPSPHGDDDRDHTRLPALSRNGANEPRTPRSSMTAPAAASTGAAYPHGEPRATARSRLMSVPGNPQTISGPCAINWSCHVSGRLHPRRTSPSHVPYAIDSMPTTSSDTRRAASPHQRSPSPS